MQEQAVSNQKKIAPYPGGTGRSIIPVPPTALIGRSHELLSAQHALDQPHTRLLTLTGPGGVGKTRLSLEIAHRIAHTFAHGATFVSLAPLNDPTLVLASIAAALGLREEAATSLIDRLKLFLRDRNYLLILDNFEQVIQAAPLLVELLSAAPQLHIIVSSRAALRVRGEHELPLHPLQLPDPAHTAQHEVIADSMALFVQAATAVDPLFKLSQNNHATVAEICRRLDGLPLAIELAAARVRMLSVQSILARLGNRLGLLTGGARDLPARQQTLRDAIAWSYELLLEHERRVFRRLATFSAGCTLEAAEEVCQLQEEAGMDMMETLGSLLEKSMVYRKQGQQSEERFAMLETIREYALEMLREAGEEKIFRDRHAAFFLQRAQRSRHELLRGDQKLWIGMLDADHDNFRGAINWLLASGNAEHAAGIGSSLMRFWIIQSYLTEGREWLEKILDTGNTLQPKTRIDLRNQLATLAWSHGDLAIAKNILQQSLADAEKLQEEWQIQTALNLLGNVAFEAGDLACSAEMHQRSLALRRKEGNQERIAGALINLANTSCSLGEFEQALMMYKEALANDTGYNNHEMVMLGTMNIGFVEYCLGNYKSADANLNKALGLLEMWPDRRAKVSLYVNLARLASEMGEGERAIAYLDEVLPIAEELEDIGRIGFVYGNMAHAYLLMGERLKALEYYRESLARHFERHYNRATAIHLVEIGIASHPLGRPRQVAMMLAAGLAFDAILGKSLPIGDQQRLATAQHYLARTLGEDGYQEALLQGSSLTIAQAVAIAQELIKAILSGQAPEMPATGESDAQSAPQSLLPPLPYPSDLTLREVEVLRLVARGLTDAETGEKLFISTRTVHAHLRSVYSKLGVTSRAGAAEFAQIHGLV